MVAATLSDYQRFLSASNCQGLHEDCVLSRRLLSAAVLKLHDDQFGRRERREERKVERTSGQVGDCQLGSCRATCEASSSASFYSDLLKLILKDANCLTPFVLRAHPFVVPQVLLAAITHNDYVALLLGFSLVMIQLTAQLTNSAGKTTKAKGCRVALTCISLVFSHLLSSDYKSLYLVAASLFASQSCHNFWL